MYSGCLQTFVFVNKGKSSRKNRCVTKMSCLHVFQTRSSYSQSTLKTCLWCKCFLIFIAMACKLNIHIYSLSTDLAFNIIKPLSSNYHSNKCFSTMGGCDVGTSKVSKTDRTSHSGWFNGPVPETI